MTSPATTPPAWPDEDAFDPPPGMVRMALPRRDQSRPKRKPDPEAVRTIASVVGNGHIAVERALANPESDPAIVDAVRRHEAGTPDPVGAAAVACVVAMCTHYPDREKLHCLGRAWLTEHGLLFAVEAAMALATIGVISESGGRAPERLCRLAEHDGLAWRWPGAAVLDDVRAAIASADDADYATIVERLDLLRTTAITRFVASYLAPTETEWAAELEPKKAYGYDIVWLYLGIVHTGEQLAVTNYSTWELQRRPRVLPTVVRTVGPAAVPTLLRWTDRSEPDFLRRVLAAVAVMPTDEAFRELLVRVHLPHHRPAVLDAMRRFPVRATRLLTAAVAEDPEGSPWVPVARELLREHLIAVPALVTEVVPTLPPAARAVAEAHHEDVVRLPEATPDSLPDVLASPPWRRTRKPAVRVVPAGLDVEPRVRLAPDELAAAEAAVRDGTKYCHVPEASGWPDQFARADAYPRKLGWMLVYGPDELARPRLADWPGATSDNLGEWGLALLARFGAAAVDFVVRSVGPSPTNESLRALFPVLSVDVAAVIARELTRPIPRRTATYTWLEPSRTAARAWLARHGVAALPYLLTAVLGRAGKPRDEAGHAVREIAAQAGVETVVAETRRLAGDTAADEVAAVLAVDPLELLPKKLPVPGTWVQPAVLPQILLRDKDFALPADSIADVLTMLALGGPGEPYGGVALVKQACDPASLAEFGWGLFEQWRKADMPSKDGWALTALGLFGDDETVRRLAPIVRAWPGEGGHARAVLGLDVLADIGTDVALMHLNGIAQKVKFGGLKQQARDRIDLVAENLGLTTEQLADRLVPDLGLAEDGTLVLDYGPRKFVVGFDERLRPFVSDEDGTPRKALPKPGAKDDAELAEASYQRFSGLKKDVRTLAADQVRRLEQAMVTSRRWTPADFSAYLVRHPLLWHVVRRLVWGVHDESGDLVGSFRVAEDRSFADVEDNAYAVPDGATVGVAHPLHLGGSVTSWAEVFADYEILQPFPQLGRPVFAFTDEERASDRLARFEGLRVPIGKVLGLTNRGWQRVVQDSGVEPGVVKPLPDGRYGVISLSEGIVVGDPTALGDEQAIDYVFLSTTDDAYWYKSTNILMSTVDSVTASELIADLTDLVSGGAK